MVQAVVLPHLVITGKQERALHSAIIIMKKLYNIKSGFIINVRPVSYIDIFIKHLYKMMLTTNLYISI